MNIFKQIALINKAKKSIKEAKKSIDKNKELTKNVKQIIGNIKLDIEALLSYLPQLKPVYKDLIDIVKEFWK